MFPPPDPLAAAKLRAALAEAETARHSLLTGTGVAEFQDQNGEKVVYAKTDFRRLEAYILELKNSLGMNTVLHHGPMGVWF